MTGTGLKKCTPTKRPASGAACASRVIGMDEVLVARIAVSDMTLPTSSKMARLMASRSVAASITSSQSAMADRLPTGSIRPSSESASSRVVFSLVTSRSSALAMPALPASARSTEISASFTA